MDVVGRIDRGDDLCGRLGESVLVILAAQAARRENVFRRAGAKRAFAHADDGQPRLLAHAVAHRQHGGRAGDGEIAEAAGELHERRAGAGRRARVAQLHHHLARLQRRSTACR